MEEEQGWVSFCCVEMTHPPPPCLTERTIHCPEMCELHQRAAWRKVSSDRSLKQISAHVSKDWISINSSWCVCFMSLDVPLMLQPGLQWVVIGLKSYKQFIEGACCYYGNLSWGSDSFSGERAYFYFTGFSQNISHIELGTCQHSTSVQTKCLRTSDELLLIIDWVWAWEHVWLVSDWFVCVDNSTLWKLLIFECLV